MIMRLGSSRSIAIVPRINYSTCIIENTYQEYIDNTDTGTDNPSSNINSSLSGNGELRFVITCFCGEEGVNYHE